jgi:signal transduction histidine kinase
MMIETIHKQSGLIVNLINELLDLARIEARQGKDFRIENQALQPIIGDAVNSLVIPGDGRKVSLKLPAEPVYAVVDAEKFRQSLMNVLSNAYKYSPNGGKISLSMQLAHRRGLDMVGIQVSDQGIGMSPEQQSRAFERFFRADPSGNIPGTGLGLCIVKEIIELLGGHVDLQSEKDKGTQVTLWLPMRSGTERIQQASSESSTGALGESN